MSETTILEKSLDNTGQQEENKNPIVWKHVILGGVPGILMGAGLLYVGQTSARNQEQDETPKEEDVAIPEQGETSYTLENGLHVAAVSKDQSFGEAFSQARAEVGPGGVFHWHGGIYNTYTEAEWNSMTIGQKQDFAQLVKPEISVNEISAPTDANPHIVVEHHVYHHEVNSSRNDEHQTPDSADDVQAVDPQSAYNFEQDDDVHIVGYANFDGHIAVGYDTDGDGKADVAIIDVDDSHDLSEADLIFDNQGHAASVGEVLNEQNSDQTASMENPEVAPDMPDYMNDVNVDDMNILA